MSNLTAALNMLRHRLIAPAVANAARCYAVKPAAPGEPPLLDQNDSNKMQLLKSKAGKKKKLGKLGPIMEKKIIPVETDANKLVNYVCGSNYFKTGEDVKLKPDSEYPDWLLTLNTDRIIPLEDLDPNSKQYWRRLRKLALRRNNQLSKLKKF
ncbi:hypothetical protein KR009_007003 [Drosophila setifemur]|nr:hypothetical protein KR009_007003 [Drosophila setifemur]